MLLIFVVAGISRGQERLRPAHRYDEGDEIFAPAYGMKSRIPKGWMGVLPRDTEVFLLMPKAGDGEIYVMGDSVDYDIMKQRWLQGLDLGNGNTLLSDGRVFERGDGIASKVILKNRTTDYKAYIEAKCSDYDRCVGGLLVAAPQNYEKLKKGLIEFMDNMTFAAPSKESIYAFFNWQEYLSNKYLMNYTPAREGKSENEIRLCENGTFLMKLKRTGQLKNDAEAYKGKTTGTWETFSSGPTGKLLLHFEQLPDLELSLLIENDQVFINSKRYFLMYGATCR
jgi:hypothetical protein